MLCVCVCVCARARARVCVIYRVQIIYNSGHNVPYKKTKKIYRIKFFDFLLSFRGNRV